MEEVIDEALLAAYQRRLSQLHFESVGFVEALILSPVMDEHRRVESLRVIPEVGVEGQYPGKQWWRGRRVPGRQISAVSAEVLEALEIPTDVPGDNLILRGFDLGQLEPGDALRVGEAVLIATHTAHRPCAKLAARTSLTKKTAMGAGRLRGILFDTRREATIVVGDAVERILI